MPEFSGFAHVGISVTDIERSTRFYTDVLGFTFLMPTDAETFRRVLLLHQPTGMFLGLVQHHASTGATFSEANAGLDHLSFSVADRDALVEWERHLAEHGVTASPIQDEFYGSVLNFRDPDGVQLEFFVRTLDPSGAGS